MRLRNVGICLQVHMLLQKTNVDFPNPVLIAHNIFFCSQTVTFLIHVVQYLLFLCVKFFSALHVTPSSHNIPFIV
jgi:hypothetical protein